MHIYILLKYVHSNVELLTLFCFVSSNPTFTELMLGT